ncbi:MAG: lytic transglycosylase domain-containing protein, partial [Pseudomonadota bacterium]
MKRRLIALTGLGALSLALAAPPGAVRAQAGAAAAADPAVQARDAHRRGDRTRLAALRTAAAAAGHPLAMWVEYFELNARLAEAQQAELDAFAARWSGTY